MMIENLRNASEFAQGFFVMICGIGGVFLVLILFFFLIRLLLKVFPEKNDAEKKDPKKIV